MRPRRFLFSSVLLLTVGGLVPLFADSVFVSSSTPDDSGGPGITVHETPVPYCQNSGTSSAFCATSFSGFAGPSPISSNAAVSANAAFGALNGSFQEYNGSAAYFVSSFGDDVIVTGGTGAGTLVSHYSLAAGADATGGNSAGNFSFVQGAAKTGVVPSFTGFGYTPPLPNPPPAGCQSYGLCFSENFDVTSPVQFGSALPLGAETYLNSDGFGARPFSNGDTIAAGSTLQLTGYTVLDASGTVIGDAVVTRQNVPGLDLFPTPEPGTWALMMAGLGGLGAWRLRRRLGLLLSLGGLLAVFSVAPVWANSVTVSSYSYPDAGLAFAAPFTTGNTQCVNSGTSSASCDSYFPSRLPYISGGASAGASAASGLLEGQVTTSDFGTTYSRAVASFSDEVTVTGGTGTGTLISHYTVALAAESNYGTQQAGGFTFVQGATRSGVTPTQFVLGSFYAGR